MVQNKIILLKTVCKVLWLDCLFTNCNYIMGRELFYGENDRCLNLIYLFCDEEREKDEEYLDVWTVEDQLSLENGELGIKHRWLFTI